MGKAIYHSVPFRILSAGRPTSQLDAQIAAITRCPGAVLVTRNVGDLDDCGIQVVNPWAS
jgi:toxin FitB